MPLGSKVAALEASLKKRYGGNDHAVYGTLNKAGLMKGSKVTKKGSRSAKRRVSQNAAHMSRMSMA